jgi:L-asparaginase
MPYTAAYLGLKLGLCDIPVVLVSAAYPLSDSRSNGLDNFRGAVDFIRSGVGKGVFVSYRNSGENVMI